MNSNKEANLSNKHNGNNIINLSNYRSLINDNSAVQLCSVRFVLKRRHSNHYQQIIGLLNINSIRSKFGLMKPMQMQHRYFYGYRNKIR